MVGQTNKHADRETNRDFNFIYIDEVNSVQTVHDITEHENTYHYRSRLP